MVRIRYQNKNSPETRTFGKRKRLQDFSLVHVSYLRRTDRTLPRALPPETDQIRNPEPGPDAAPIHPHVRTRRHSNAERAVERRTEAPGSTADSMGFSARVDLRSTARSLHLFPKTLRVLKTLPPRPWHI